MMAENPIRQPSPIFKFSDFFNHASKYAVVWITTLGFLFVVLSYIFETGYFAIVGFKFMGLLSTYDYLHHSIVIMSTCAFAFVVQGLYMDSRGRNRSETMARLESSTLTSDHEKLGQMRLMHKFYLGVLFLFLLSLLFIFPLILSIIVISFLLIGVLAASLLRHRIERRLFLFFVGLIALFLCAFCEGVTFGFNDASRSSYEYSISLDDDSPTQKASVLRIVGSGVIYILESEPKEARYSPWEHIYFVKESGAGQKPLRLIDFIGLRWSNPDK